MTEEKQQPRRLNTAAITGVVVIVLIIVAAGLAWLAWRTIEPPPTPIGTVLNDLRTYDGQGVTVAGTVENPLNLLGLKTYDLTDDSGTIRVVTERGLPKAGDEIHVTGMVSEVFNVAGVNMTVIMETAETTD
ncbi:OB-fold nucleic acid binding domain-containing protein [bacterium]|nr:OB-fold nucleic acid binding domain-containing protein [bacterium]